MSLLRKREFYVSKGNPTERSRKACLKSTVSAAALCYYIAILFAIIEPNKTVQKSVRFCAVAANS